MKPFNCALLAAAVCACGTVSVRVPVMKPAEINMAPYQSVAIGGMTGNGDRPITEAQLEAGFHRWLPTRSVACGSRLEEFFRQWFDTAYPAGGGANRPGITGPGLAGAGLSTGPAARMAL